MLTLTSKCYRYSPVVRADIGKYSSQHGVRKAARFFSRKLDRKISETTVRSIRDSYRTELKCKRDDGDSGDVDALPLRKRGRKLLLGEDIDEMVQSYLRKIRKSGGSVSATIVVAAARGILLASDRSMLAEFGGHVELKRHWAYSLLKRMGFVRRKATTAKSKQSIAEFAELKRSFLADVVATVTMESIPDELILNWDQTGLNIVPSSAWTMEQRGAKRVEVVGVKDKRQITGVFCCSLSGEFLPHLHWKD